VVVSEILLLIVIVIVVVHIEIALVAVVVVGNNIIIVISVKHVSDRNGWLCCIRFNAIQCNVVKTKFKQVGTRSRRIFIFFLTERNKECEKEAIPDYNCCRTYEFGLHVYSSVHCI
jgi:hypothetical protein